MEFANHWHPQESSLEQPGGEVRIARESDAAGISRLLRTAEGSHVHVDWRLPVDWLGLPSFVVVPGPREESGGLISKFFSLPERLTACLAATADPLPAAWVRVAAVARSEETPGLLARMLDMVEPALRETAVSQLGWLVGQSWPNRWLPQLGFEMSNQIETYVKESFDLPPFQSPPDLCIRPARTSDFGQLAAMETAVFEPLWRLSGETLAIAQRDALCFDVAEWNGRLVGYQLSSSGPYSAHLVRLTIAKEAQGHGVGSALLAAAIRAYRRLGLRRVTLNTQVDNLTSQHLYQKFGFSATGEKLPIWTKTI